MRVVRIKFKKTFRLVNALAYCPWAFFYDWFYLGHVKAVFQNWNYAKSFFFKLLITFSKTLSLNQYLKFFIWVFFIKACFMFITEVTELHQTIGFTLETCLLFFLYYRLFSPVFSIKNILKDFFLTFFTIYVVFFFFSCLCYLFDSAKNSNYFFIKLINFIITMIKCNILIQFFQILSCYIFVKGTVICNFLYL